MRGQEITINLLPMESMHDIQTASVKVLPCLREYILSVNDGSDIITPGRESKLWGIVKMHLDLVPDDYRPVLGGTVIRTASASPCSVPISASTTGTPARWIRASTARIPSSWWTPSGGTT